MRHLTLLAVYEVKVQGKARRWWGCHGITRIEKDVFMVLPCNFNKRSAIIDQWYSSTFPIIFMVNALLFKPFSSWSTAQVSEELSGLIALDVSSEDPSDLSGWFGAKSWDWGPYLASGVSVYGQMVFRPWKEEHLTKGQFTQNGWRRDIDNKNMPFPALKLRKGDGMSWYRWAQGAMSLKNQFSTRFFLLK